MIIDTTYLLRLSSLEIDTDLLRAVYEGATDFSIEEIGVSLISLFELQAKVAKLRLPPQLAIDAIGVINKDFRVEPFYEQTVVELADILSRKLKDYIDCLILATAIALKEDLITEDSKIIDIRDAIKRKYGISIFNYREVKKSMSV